MSEENRGKIIYRRLENGIEIYDAEYYNQTTIDFARNTRNAFLVTAIFVAIVFVIFVVIPFATGFVHQTVCSVPNWPVIGECP
jgi:hypothetical protein